jgi:hypothetical protein
MDRVYLDCTGLPNSIPVRSELPNSIYVDASDLQRVLNSFLESLPNAILEGLKANPVENLVRQGEVQPMQKGGRFEVEKHNGADKSFCIKVPEDFNIYLQVDYDDVDHEMVDKEAAVIVALLNTHIEAMRALLSA